MLIVVFCKLFLGFSLRCHNININGTVSRYSENISLCENIRIIYNIMWGMRYVSASQRAPADAHPPHTHSYAPLPWSSVVVAGVVVGVVHAARSNIQLYGQDLVRPNPSIVARPQYILHVPVNVHLHNVISARSELPCASNGRARLAKNYVRDTAIVHD